MADSYCNPFCTCCCPKDTFDFEFEKIAISTANNVIPTTKYVSKNTGLQIVHAEVEGPIVNGYICISTRAEDDDGLAHTLEHLIFLGSEDFPYAGVLDRLANKCLASGTHGWTDVDHTCFTLNTGGSSGFCQLLPIYLDHIFYPLLTEEAFKTEVYHITGAGTDAGVVYSEMQASENTSYSRAVDKLYKTVFPEQSGYRWIAGGALQNLRESCSIEKVRTFHRKYYHPKNTCLVVCGMLDPSQLFLSLRPVIEKWVMTEKSFVKPYHCIRPWSCEKEIADLAASSEETVFFPTSDDQASCTVIIGFLGPPPDETESDETSELNLLMKYLTKSTCSPLQQAFIQKQESLATSLDFYLAEYSRALFYFVFEGVKVKNKQKIVPRLRRAIKKAMDEFDMNRMADLLNSCIQSELSRMENEPHTWVSQVAIQDFLYGNGNYGRFYRRLNGVLMLEDLLSAADSFWKDKLEDSILNSEWVTVIAEPSMAYLKQLISQEDLRVSTRVGMGKAKLKEYKDSLEAAIAVNSKPIPRKILNRVKVPSLKSIGSHKIRRMCNPSWVSPSDFPSNLCFDVISTSFVYVAVIMDTSSLDEDFREYLPLFKEVLMNSEIMPDFQKKRVIQFEDVVAARDRDIQLCEMGTGLELIESVIGDSNICRCVSANNSHLLCFVMQMEVDKIQSGMEWIGRILWETKWTFDRVKVGIAKLLGDMQSSKSQGSITDQIMDQLLYKEDSNIVKSSALYQLKFLKEIGAENDKLLAQSENLIRTAFDYILNLITDPINLSLHIAANISRVREKLECVASGNLSMLLRRSFPFELSGNESVKQMKRFASRPDTDYMLSYDFLRMNRGNCQLIYGMGSEDSSNLVMVGKGPGSFQDKEIPALLTTLQYFTQVEGPLFRTIRGGGYAHSYRLTARISEGLIYFSLLKCSDLVGGYQAVLKVMKIDSWDKDLLVSAKSSLIFECLETEKTPLALASNSCLSYYRRVPQNYIRDLIGKVGEVKLKHLKKITKKYLKPLFENPKNCFATVVVCPSDQVKNISGGLERLGKKLSVLESLDDLVKDDD